MANFNTNQARHFYAAKDYKDTLAGVSAVGDIAVGATASVAGGVKSLFFSYMNGDGLLTRSDSISADCISYVNKVAAADMDRPLIENAITINSDFSEALANKKLTLNVVVRQFGSLDENASFPVVAVTRVGGNVVASNIYKDLALKLAKALPTFNNPNYPFFKVYLRTSDSDFEVTRSTDAASLSGSYTALVVIAPALRWRRGLMDNSPAMIDIAFATDADIDGAWGINTRSESATLSIPATFALADEEWFCYGERGDEARGYNYPNNVEPAYLINPFDSSVSYDVMTIQYFYKGNGEDVQKSQKTIRIAAPHEDLEALYEDFCLKAGLIVGESGVTGISLNKSTLSLAVGAYETLAATLAPESAAATITWASSDSAKASVDTAGKVTGVAAGSANITATCNDKTATCAVTVA